MINFPQAPVSEFEVPRQLSRGYGQPLTDVRGRGFYLAVGSLATGLASLGVTVFLFSLGGLSILPGMMAIYLGIMGLKGAKKPYPTPFSSRAVQYSIWGIVCGALTVLLTLGGIILLATMSSDYSGLAV